MKLIYVIPLVVLTFNVSVGTTIAQTNEDAQPPNAPQGYEKPKDLDAITKKCGTPPPTSQDKSKKYRILSRIYRACSQEVDSNFFPYLRDMG